MTNYKKIDCAKYMGPDFHDQPDLLNNYKDTYACISEGMTFAFSMHWLISCLFFGDTPPSDVAEYIYINTPEFCNGASTRYSEASKATGKTSANLRTDYLDTTKKFVEEISKFSVTTSANSLVNINGVDVGRLVKLAECTNQILLTIYFNPLSNESNDEVSHTIAIRKYNEKYYLFDPDFGVYCVDRITDLGKFIRNYFSLYVPQNGINRYSCVEILPAQQNQYGKEG